MSRTAGTTWLALTLAGAAGVHAVVAAAHVPQPGHVGADAVHGTFFVVLAGLELALALALVVDPRRWVLRASVALNTGTLLLWVLTRTSGLPGQGPEPVAGADLFTAGLEIAAAVLAARLLATTRRRAGESVRLRPIVSTRVFLLVAGTLATAMVGASALGASAGHDHHGPVPDFGMVGHLHPAGHLGGDGHPGHAGTS